MTKQNDKVREPLIGFMILEDWAEDYSQWDGHIAFPDPEGANIYWQNTTKMIEHSAYRKLQEELAEKQKLLDECIELISDVAPSWLPEGPRHRRTELLTKLRERNGE